MKLLLSFRGVALVLGYLLSGIALAEPVIEIWGAKPQAHYLSQALARWPPDFLGQFSVKPADMEAMKSAFISGGYKGKLPHAVIIPSDLLGVFADIGLKPVPKAWLEVSAGDVQLQAGMVDGVTYGIPLTRGNHAVLYYNKALVSEPITSWEQLLAQAPEFEQQGIHPIAWQLRESQLLIPFLSAFDGWLHQPMKGEFDTEAMRQALAHYQQSLERWPHLSDAACDENCLNQAFAQGQYAYYIGGDWALADLRQSMGEQLGICRLPTIGERPMTPMSGYYLLGLTRRHTSPAQHEALQTLIKYLQAPATQQQTYMQLGLLPSNQRALAAVLQQVVSADEAARIAQLNHSQSMANDQVMESTWLVINKGLERLVDGEYSAEQAAEYMQYLSRWQGGSQQ